MQNTILHGVSRRELVLMLHTLLKHPRNINSYTYHTSLTCPLIVCIVIVVLAAPKLHKYRDKLFD